MQSEGCFECGSSDSLHAHHVVPRSKGGTRTVMLCERCHGLVHSRDLTTSALVRFVLAKKRAEGRRTSKDAPFGWSIGDDGDTLEKNAAEQRAIELIRELRAGGMSIRGIAARLGDLGHSPRGARWHKTTLERIIAAADNG